MFIGTYGYASNEGADYLLTGKRNAECKTFDKLSDKQKSINSNNPDALLKVLVMVSSCSSCL